MNASASALASPEVVVGEPEDAQAVRRNLRMVKSLFLLGSRGLLSPEDVADDRSQGRDK